MAKTKCEICGGDGTFKTKKGEIKTMLVAIPPFPKKINLNATKSFHWRCIKCRLKEMY